jgi:hypothetical protein
MFHIYFFKFDFIIFLHSINKKEIKHPNTTKTNACPTGQHTSILFQRSSVVQILERATFFAI